MTLHIFADSRRRQYKTVLSRLCHGLSDMVHNNNAEIAAYALRAKHQPIIRLSSCRTLAFMELNSSLRGKTQRSPPSLAMGSCAATVNANVREQRR